MPILISILLTVGCFFSFLSDTEVLSKFSNTKLNQTFSPLKVLFNHPLHMDLSNSLSSTNSFPKWTKLNTASYPGKQDDICFIDEQTGWYVNGGGNIYKTTDGGVNWKKCFYKPGTFFRCIAFLDSLHGYAGNVGTDYFPNVQDTVPLYQTIDGGNSWTPVPYQGPVVKGLCAIDIVKEQYINHGSIAYRHSIYAVGRVGSPAMLMLSEDNGKSFRSQSMMADCKMLFDIKMFNRKEGFVCAAT